MKCPRLRQNPSPNPHLSPSGLLSTPPSFKVLKSAILTDHRLPASWSGVFALVFLFPKMRVLHGEEPLLTPGVNSIAAQHNRKAVQILPLLTVTRITLGVATRTEGLTASLTLHHQFSSLFI